MKWLLLLLLAGCTLYESSRPMGVGVKWVEWEKFNNIMHEGNYIKECIYTKVTVNGEYEYDCNYRFQ